MISVWLNQRDQLMNVIHKLALHWRGCDKVLEYKMTASQSDCLATCHMKLPPICEEVKQGETDQSE